MQLARLLNAAPGPNSLRGITIPGVSGLRTAELPYGLSGVEVDQPEDLSPVSAKTAKTAKLRLIPIAPNLADG